MPSRKLVRGLVARIRRLEAELKRRNEHMPMKCLECNRNGTVQRNGSWYCYTHGYLIDVQS